MLVNKQTTTKLAHPIKTASLLTLRPNRVLPDVTQAKGVIVTIIKNKLQPDSQNPKRRQKLTRKTPAGTEKNIKREELVDCGKLKTQGKV